MSRYKGFSLIELLVVVTIIAILSAIGITAFGSISANARDAKRKADVDAIAKALENKFNPETGEYPADLQANYFTANALPQKPEGSNYEDITWTDSGHTGFQVCVTLDNGSTKYCKQSSQGKFAVAATPVPSPVVVPSTAPIPASPSIYVAFLDPAGAPVSGKVCSAVWDCTNYTGSTYPEIDCTGFVTTAVIEKPTEPGNCRGVTYYPSQNPGKVIIGVTPSPQAGYKRDDSTGQWLGWSDDWSVGQRSLTFVIASPTPTVAPTPTPKPYRTVFVTKDAFQGNLGGLSGADEKCGIAAARKGMDGRNFKAWLSDGSTAAKDRLTHAEVPYKLLNGNIVANNWSDLTDGTLRQSIAITEDGLVLPQGEYVWTNTESSGSIKNILHCSNWTNNSNTALFTTAREGGIGLNSDVSTGWTSRGTEGCAAWKHLYCFEQ